MTFFLLLFTLELNKICTQRLRAISKFAARVAKSFTELLLYWYIHSWYDHQPFLVLLQHAWLLKILFLKTGRRVGLRMNTKSIYIGLKLITNVF